MTTPANLSALDLIVGRELEVLQQLDAVLNRESVALSALEYAAIDEACERKQDLDLMLRGLQSERAKLSGPIDPDLRGRYNETATRVHEACESNNRRLKVSMDTIQGIIATLTGTPVSAYGNRKSPVGIAAPVLTSSLG